MKYEEEINLQELEIGIQLLLDHLRKLTRSEIHDLEFAENFLAFAINKLFVLIHGINECKQLMGSFRTKGHES